MFRPPPNKEEARDSIILAHIAIPMTPISEGGNSRVSGARPGPKPRKARAGAVLETSG